MKELTIYSKEELKKIQYLEKELLKEVVRICNSLNIEYFLIGGSALGAVRHNGFIPWDDDIDIGMTRNNYDRFLKEAPIMLSSKYHLQTPYNTKNTPYPYTKIRIDNTLFVEYCNRKLNIHHGVYIDVFPFDKVPISNFLNLMHFKICRILIYCFTLRQVIDVSQPPKNFTQKIKGFIRELIHMFFKLIPYKLLVILCDKFITIFNSSKNSRLPLSCLFFPKRNTEYILPKDLYPLQLHKFEDFEANIPNNYNQYLTTHYGDWNKLPPEEKQFGHKPYIIKLEK